MSGGEPRADYGFQPDGSYVIRGSGTFGAAVDRNHGAADRVPPPQTPETTRQKLTGLGYEALWQAARRLPTGMAFAATARGARLLARRPPAGPDAQLRANLARVVAPEDLERTVEQAYVSAARYYMEAFRAADMDPDWFMARTTHSGFEHLDAALEEGRGAIVLLAHHGSWDMAALWAETIGYHLACVAEVLRPRSVFKKFVAMREALGLEIVPLRRGDDVTGRLTEVLKANHMIGLLADRDLTGKGPLVDFFGEPARIPPGPALLNRRTGSKIIPITMMHRPDLRYHITALPAVETEGLDVRGVVQACAKALEELIRLDPAQWHAFQPIFEADRLARQEARP